MRARAARSVRRRAAARSPRRCPPRARATRTLSRRSTSRRSHAASSTRCLRASPSFRARRGRSRRVDERPHDREAAPLPFGARSRQRPLSRTVTRDVAPDVARSAPRTSPAGRRRRARSRWPRPPTRPARCRTASSSADTHAREPVTERAPQPGQHARIRVERQLDHAPERHRLDRQSVRRRLRARRPSISAR